MTNLLPISCLHDFLPPSELLPTTSRETLRLSQAGSLVRFDRNTGAK